VIEKYISKANGKQKFPKFHKAPLKYAYFIEYFPLSLGIETF
jgi:hypothetical protein